MNNSINKAPSISPIAVVILTFNESKNIRHAIRSISDWAEQIFVVDSFSTDDTVAIAKSLGAEVYQNTFIDYSTQWNWALNNLPLTAKWTLKLDADERVTPEFKVEFQQFAADNAADVAGIFFRRSIIFFGKRVRFGGIRDNYDLRLWRTGSVRFENRSCNEHAVADGPTSRFHSYIEHHDYKSLSHWIDKHNRYSSMEVREMVGGNLLGEVSAKFFGTPDERRMWLRRMYFRIPIRPLAYFAYRYFLRLGFLDGRIGFRYAFLHSVFYYWIDLKRSEYQQTGELPDILWPARAKPTTVK